jgi:hypothetical protein
LIDYAIEKLTELLIKQDFKEKETGDVIYVKKSQAYRDLIKLLKKYQKDFKND